ncbi:MAG: ABC transporter ATP-binding protein [Candidatus Geothermarchaeales archaeon]
MAILVTEKLKKYFGEVHAVDEVDFQVKEGEMMSLVGPNGAGKTTLVNLISGYLIPDSGRILFLGNDITRKSPYARIRDGVARSFQLVNLYDELTLLDNVRIAILSRAGKTMKFFTLLERDTEVRKEAEDLLDAFGIRELENLLPTGVSQGDRKLLDVAIAVALKPKLLMLDEPTSGVSSREKRGIMDRIVDVVRGEKISSLIVEHDMDIVQEYSDRVAVMHEGKMLAIGGPDEVMEDPKVKSTLLGV